ncbi:TonB-dependent receptor family protein [Tamilnaduibacter salinus]|uniref:TonB-dependent receptor family protein n=1 Tax=Tamilnaduibacter salinus TaxID=1484056 RepID=UPI001D179A73|nr:TonB-dependent receptor [Tamilnaduibacter salinus]
MRQRHLIGVFSILLLAEAAQSQGPSHPDDTVIKVSSPRLTRPLYETPAAVSVVNRPAIQIGQQRLHLSESLDTVPGLFFQNRTNFAQGLRLSTRGFGARAPFGIRGIHIQVDGIPSTLPDGQAQIDALSLDSAERIEIIRGPSSVQYGNAAGGAIAVTTASGDQSPPDATLRLDGGSHGYRKGTVEASEQWADTSAHASLSWLDFEGYREQSEVRQGRLNTRIAHDWSGGQRLTVTLNALDTPTAEDPSGLSRTEVAEDRQQATEFARRLDSGQTVDQQTIGLNYEDPALLPGTLTLNTFFTHRDFAQQLPFPGSSRIAYDRLFYGSGADYQGRTSLVGHRLRYSVGAEVNRQSDERRRYEIGVNGDNQGQVQDETQTATEAGVFAEGDLALTSALSLSLGARFDRLRLAIDDQRLSDGDDSGERIYRETSGSAGLNYRITPSHQAYATIGTAFESPTFTEFANPDGSGGFNPEIGPQDALNREIGLRGTVGRGLSYELAAFLITVDDEILPFEQNGRTFYENAGETQRDGIELGVDWSLSYAWRLTSALTLADYRLENFRDSQGNNVDGNRFPGLPQEQWVSELTWRSTDQAFAAVELSYTGEVYAENSNQTRVSDYWLVNLRAGDSFAIGEQTIDVYGGLRNVTDEAYFSNIRVNANSDQPVDQRGYFEPAPGRTIYLGVALNL